MSKKNKQNQNSGRAQDPQSRQDQNNCPQQNTDQNHSTGKNGCEKECR